MSTEENAARRRMDGAHLWRAEQSLAYGFPLTGQEDQRALRVFSVITMPLQLAEMRQGSAMVTADDVRTVALSLPRTEEALVRDQVKFRVGRIVYVALSRDERSMGFGFPKDERAALVAAQPEKFFMPIPSDMRYQWVQVWLDAIDLTEMRELVVDAWRMVVPKRVAAEYLDDHIRATTPQWAVGVRDDDQRDEPKR
jgi:hypothetical protein